MTPHKKEPYPTTSISSKSSTLKNTLLVTRLQQGSDNLEAPAFCMHQKTGASLIEQILGLNASCPSILHKPMTKFKTAFQ